MKRTGIAAFSDLRTPSSDGVRDAITTRPSASANFFVDSEDRVNYPTSSPADFTINKNQSLFNGFFNRISVAEVVLNWRIPNVASYWGNDTITIENAATTAVFTANFFDGYYSPVDMLQVIAQEINDQAIAAGDPLRLSVLYTSGELQLKTNVGQQMIIYPGVLTSQLFDTNQTNLPISTAYSYVPVILGTKYIDIVCSQLTYNQELKDNTTAPVNRDVLYRWYFAYDNVPPSYDTIVAQISDGNPAAPVPYPPTFAEVVTDIPMLQGYNYFIARRTPPITRQIRWSPEQPIGQVSFQVYDDQGRLLQPSSFGIVPHTTFGYDFQMSLLLSED